ncbi:MAG TPA: hypothetical protein VFQ53_05465 [Kofleriaceae bacterium]|nr:hypothetical protein [Kofleriaceae bacterium]
MGWRVAASVLVLSGCQLVFPLDGPDKSAGDADPGDGLQGQPACFDGFLDLCTLGAVPSTREFDGGAIQLDTSDDRICTPLAMSSQADLCAIVAGTIRITSGTSVRVVGVRPFALVAVDGLRIEGTLDVAGHSQSTKLAAGAPNLACNVGTLPILHGGGAGGSFGTVGGGGGNNTGNTSVRPGIPGAIVMPPATLRAGCPGQDGGLDTPQGSTTLVDAGAAGGAVYLRSIGTLEISGIVNASGGGGLGGHGLTTPNEGGGGGGAAA